VTFVRLPPLLNIFGPCNHAPSGRQFSLDCVRMREEGGVALPIDSGGAGEYRCREPET